MKKLMYLIASSSLLGIYSCNPVYYAPTLHQAPLFKEKNEARVTAATNFETVGEFNAAY